MNVLVLNPILYSGQGDFIPQVETIKDTMIYNMCLGFKKLNHNVTLLALEDYKPIYLEKYDFEIIFFKNNAKGFFPAALPYSRSMNRFIKNHINEYDMILSSEAFSFHSLAAALYGPHKTVIWHELTTHQRKFYTIPSRCWHNLVVRFLFQKIRIVIPRSYLAQKFISRYLKQISNQPLDHGINISKFKVQSIKKRQFICIAQLIKRKSVDSIIYKFKAFISNPKYSDFKLLIAGRGDLEKSLRELVLELNIESNVDFLGFISHEELTKYVSESYASLINTQSDLNMVSIPEAIVAGTPIVTNMNPALASFINQYQLGIAKSNWGAIELETVVVNNIYRQNCINMRKQMSTEYIAQKMIDLFIQ